MGVTYDEILAVEPGAQFWNADLHVHSFGGSHDVTDSTMTPQSLVESAVRQGINLLAITDHNSDKNVEAALSFASAYSDRLLVLPAVEVTTAHGHLLVYFAPDHTQALSAFLGKIDLVGRKGAADSHTAKSMADVAAIADSLGAICLAAHIDRDKTGFERLSAGYPNWKRDILTSPGIYGLECDRVESLAWYSGDEAGHEGAERTRLAEARQAIRALQGRVRLAHVQASDAHSMGAFENQSLEKPWTRMKLSELTFDALRTALIDPAARVVARRVLPPSIPRIRGMAISGGFLHGETVHFSGNLNCFIGGRGTGKSTALRSIGHCFGRDPDFAGYDSCPDSIVIYCEDGNGVIYKYERSRGGDISVRVKDGGAITTAPVNAFGIEYFGQGALAKVAEDPPRSPRLLQEFLDRYIDINDLIAEESSLVERLQSNASQLQVLETTFLTLGRKRTELQELDAKLRIAEDGKLREVVAAQRRIHAEKAIRESIEDTSRIFRGGISLAVVERDYTQIAEVAGEVTEDPTSQRLLAEIRTVIEQSNATLRAKATEINALLSATATELTQRTTDLQSSHAAMEAAIGQRIASLREKGLAGSITELDTLLRNKHAVTRDITQAEQRRKELDDLRTQRTNLLDELRRARTALTERRKAQLAHINKSLGQTIPDYRVFFKYEDSGIVDKYLAFVLDKMTGSYLQDQTARTLCENVEPQDLAEYVRSRQADRIAKHGRIDSEWASRIQQKLCYWNTLFELQVMPRPPKPVIVVRTKSTPPREIPVTQLSDGQRHTILLTVAMLAETNIPLVIDQPEDDLDNAFIFSSVVRTLRAVKERRQVILVTHNANIAVLGDSELLLPMQRTGDCARILERGSIDRAGTKQRVLDILEGGADAFSRRRRMYGH